MPTSRQMKGRDAIAAPRGWREVCRLRGGRRGGVASVPLMCSVRDRASSTAKVPAAAVSLSMAGDMTLKNRGRIALCLSSYARFSTSKEDCICRAFQQIILIQGV